MIRFTKMHGAGNDYIYVYTPDYPIEDPVSAAIEWSRPHFGIGSDGLILIGDSEVADFSMRIFNNDGSEALMCGNGVRCAGKFVYDHHLTCKTTVSIETLSGIKIIDLILGEDGKVARATVDMGAPVLRDRSLCATPDGGITGPDGTFVSMGNPHFVKFVPDALSVDLAVEGRKLELDQRFPQRCNIEFSSLRPDGSIRVRVWERGSGVTQACGTGACAAAVAARLNKLAGRECDIEMDGGILHIEWRESDGHVYMTGPADTVFEGSIGDY